MTNAWLKYGLNFILIVLVQALVVNPWEIHAFLNPMVYPMLILMLPFDLSVLATLIISFALGIAVDGFSNTFGLHASAAMVVGYLRPTILKYIKPRDGYDATLMPSIHDMGMVWFMGYTAFFLLIHHIWFFTLEIFKLDFLLIFAKTFSSLLFSMLLIVLLQFILYKPSKK